MGGPKRFSGGYKLMRKALTILVGAAVLLAVSIVVTSNAQVYIRPGQLSQSWTCSLDGIAATLTECKAARGAGLSLYLTDVVAQSTTAIGGQFLLRTGTGTNCATGTASLLPSAATVVRLAHPANTVEPLLIRFVTPIKTPANSAICVLGVATNTVTIQLSGFTAP